MASHYDFKDRGYKYLFFSDVAGVISVPLIKSIVNGMVIPYIYVYRRILPILLIDVISIGLLFAASFKYLLVAVVLQLCAVIYAYKIHRIGYFILWKSALINIYRTVKIMRRKVRYVENDVIRRP